MLGGGDLLRQREAGHLAHALAHRRARHIHGGVARADDVDALAQAIAVRVVEIVDAEVHVAQRLALDVQGVGLPHARAQEDGLVAVAEQILDGDRAADGRVRAHLDVLEHEVMILEVVQHGLGQAEGWDAVAQHAADLVLALEDGDLIALAREDDRDGQPCRAGADDRHADAVALGRALDHLVGIGAGDVVLDGGEVHRRALAAQHAVPLALVLVIAHQRADGGQRIVFKERPPGLVELSVEHHADHLGNRRVDRAALLALGHLAVEAALRLLEHMYGHRQSSFQIVLWIHARIHIHLTTLLYAISKKGKGGFCKSGCFFRQRPRRAPREAD